jgi:hypoxanthine phosphoribosyltransferase
MLMSASNSNPTLEVLISEARIAARVQELAVEISADYHDRLLHLIGVLNGSWVFLADLSRHLEIPVTVDFMGISSYGQGTTSSGEVRITKDLDGSLAGLDILVVEDILDSGSTFLYLEKILKARQPRSLRLVTLLDKPVRRVQPVRADYVGFTIPDLFVVGYGLDYAQQYRHLRDVCVLRLPGSESVA